MEIRRGVEPLISCISMACLVMMLFVGSVDCTKSRLAKMTECYGPRYRVCALTQPRLYCAGAAAAECAKENRRFSRHLLLSVPLDEEKDTLKHRYCELGCDISRCSNTTTPNDIEEFAKCLEFCSKNTCKPKTSSALTDQMITKTADEQTNYDFCKLGCATSVCGPSEDRNTNCGSCATTCS